LPTCVTSPSEGELIDPRMESHFLDPKFILGSDKNSGNGEASFLAMDACLVRFLIDPSRVVTKASMSGIGASVCDQVIQHFLLQFGPDGVGKHKKVLDLGLGMGKGMTSSSSNAAAKPSKKVLCLRKVCELLPVLDSHNIVRIRKEVVRHCVGHKHWKILLLVIVRNKVR